MSKTDKTRPVWVKLLDPSMSRFVWERHDHRRGPCDLDRFPWVAKQTRSWFPVSSRAWYPQHPLTTRCALEVRWGCGEKFWHQCNDRCFGFGWRRQNEKRRRGELRKTKREALKTPISEMDTVDFFYSTKTYY
jgi:hypothetical protein